MAIVGDPVGSGFVEGLAHPGGNITGLSMMMSDLATKRLQLLKELLPGLRRVAVLWDPTVSWHQSALDELTAAAHLLSIEVKAVRVTRREEFRPAFSEIRKRHAEAIYVLENALFVAERAELFKLAFGARSSMLRPRRRWDSPSHDRSCCKLMS
jgi:putative ABC transport system substrate-binding protein